MPKAKRPRAVARRSRRPASSKKRREPGLGQSKVIAFLATADSSRARTFYESVIGLRLIGDEPFALVFEANGVPLRIQKVERVTPAPYTALGWIVADVAATIRSLSATGVQPQRYGGLEQDDLGIWRSPGGARIAWFKDPDGHILSLTQV